MLKADPAFADIYLAAALEEAGETEGQAALLAALRYIAEAQVMAAVAERAGIPRENLYRALSSRGNPTIKTLLAVLTSKAWAWTDALEELRLIAQDHHPHWAQAAIAKQVGAWRCQAQRLVQTLKSEGLLSVVANAHGGAPGSTPQDHPTRTAFRRGRT